MIALGIWNLKYNTHNLVYRTETRHKEQTGGCQSGRGCRGGVDWEFEINKDKLVIQEGHTRSYCTAQNCI